MSLSCPLRIPVLLRLLGPGPSSILPAPLPRHNCSTPSHPTTTFRRHIATARRTTKHLHLGPDPSFLPLPQASIRTSQSPYIREKYGVKAPRSMLISESRSRIIYNPPSSMPSVYDTPNIFLPAGDPRKALSTPQSADGTAEVTTNTNSSSSSSSSPHLPPPLRPITEKKYHLTEADISEIRRLREEDPVKNSRTILAKRYNASRFFVGMVAEASQQHKKKKWQEMESVKESWGKRRREAREGRKRRREGWGGADEL